MEFQLPIFPLYFAFVLFLFMIVKHQKDTKAQSTNPKLPPGPQKLPLIGNLHQLTGSLPHHSLRDLAKKYGPIMHLQLGEVSAIVVSSPQAAKEVMQTHDLIFADRPQLLAIKIMSYDSTGIAFAPYGNYWRQVRKICILELLSAKRVHSFKSIREEEVRNLIGSISTLVGIQVNFTEKIGSFINDTTSRAAFGKKCKYQDEFIAVTKEAAKLAGGFDVPDIFPSLKFLHGISRMKPALEKLHRRMDKILDDIINEHKVREKAVMINGDISDEEDLVDVLLKLQESVDLNFPLTANNVKAIILDIFSAGTETSSTTIEWAMSEMMRNPKVMEHAQDEVRRVLKGKGEIEETDIQELHYLKMVIKETLRLHPPAPLLLPRQSRERCEINGYERFDGSLVDLKGTNFEFIPFGAGRRMCPGVVFGIANIELPLAQLLYRFEWKLPNGIKPDQLDMEETLGITAARKNELYLIASPYIEDDHMVLQNQ
ncbi:hypothetical protein LguiA_022816 [Lonicera macranthoides]